VVRDPERFSKIWAGVQSIVLSSAVVVGGIWSLYTFISLNLIGKARADLERSQEETKQLHDRQPVLITTMSFVQERAAFGGYDVAISVLIENKGSRNTQIGWTKATPLAIVAANGDSNKHFVSSSVITAKPLSLGSQPPDQYQILSGGSARLPFLVHVPRPALYYVEFQAEVRVADVSGKDNPTSSPSDRPLVWSDTAFIAVHP
jgi:hypothetical protein